MTGPVPAPELLDFVRGLLVLLVAGYLLAFRPFARRALWLAVAAAFAGLRGVLPIGPDDFPLWLYLCEHVAFLAFLTGFPHPVRPRSFSGLAVVVSLGWWIASLVYVATGQVPADEGQFLFIDRMLYPTALGGVMTVLLVIIARLRDLRGPGIPENERRAAPFLYVFGSAGVFTGGGSVLGVILNAWLGRGRFPLFFYETPEGPWFAIASTLSYALVLVVALQGIRRQWWVPVLLFTAGFVSYLPILARPTLEADLATTLRLWGYLLSPVFVMYAQARWAPFKGEPELGSGGWIFAGFAGAFAYAFVLIAFYAVSPGTVIDYVVGPVVALLVATAIAVMVLPRARKAQLGRMLTLAGHESLAIGSLVLGRYRVLRILGEGGQARVYEAMDKKDGQHVVLKALGSEEAANEAHALKGLQHPNIIRLIDVIEVPGVTLLVLEFADGGTLRGLLKRHTGGLPPSEARPLLDGILAGLEASHLHGLAHRDVKPENVFLAAGVPKLADFGAAQSVKPGSTLRAGRGTLAYLAPEQVRGEPGDACSDVYAAGMLVHEVLTGRPPLAVPSDDFLARQAILEQPAKVTLSHAAIARVVQRALSKEPNGRFKDAGELRAKLEGAWTA